jgi:type II secretory pathway pseudopilin PulG
VFPSPHIPRTRVADDGGFVLIELIVSMIAAGMAAAVAFLMIQVSMGQAARVTASTNATRQGRAALEKVMSVLHNSCVAPRVVPVSAGSDGSKLLIVSEASGGGALQSVRLHEIALANGILTDTSYPDAGTKAAPEWEFSKTGTTTRLATGVGAVRGTPVFQYFAHSSGSEPQGSSLATPLSSSGAAETDDVTVTFTMLASESGNANSARTFALTDAAPLRLNTSSSGEAAPCA